jgi:uncharacterized membrane protein YidH (DUF202 family)
VIEPSDDREAFGGEGARTDLAWNRSGLSLAVAAAAVLKVVVDIGDYRAPTIVFGVIIAGTVAWGLSLAHARYVAAGSLEGQLHADQRKLKTVAVITTLFAVAAFLIALLPSP